MRHFTITKMTNYHIHLVFSERKILEHPEVKIATRNMFYDEQGKHRRTKKEILDEQEIFGQDAVLFPKGKFMRAIFLQRKMNGLRVMFLPEKSRKCLRKSSTAM